MDSKFEAVEIDGRKPYEHRGVSQSLIHKGTTANEAHVVALIPRGEVVRNFVYTGCFDYVREDAQLSLISVVLNSGIDEILRQKSDILLPLNIHSERWIVRIQRELLDMAHGRWLWSKAAQERWRVRDREATSIAAKAKRVAKKALALPFASNAGLALLSRSERSASRRFNNNKEYLELFKKTRPSLVFNGSHIHSANAIPAVQAAQWLGIPTATFIFSWDNLTSQGRIILPYDYFLVWNDKLKEQLLEMYPWIRPENVFVTGTPQFDFHFRPETYNDRATFCDEIGADPHRPIVLYSTGMPNHMPSEPEIVEELSEFLDSYPFPKKPQLLVRVYGKDQTNRFDDLQKRRSDIIFQNVAWDPAWLTPQLEDSSSLVNTLRHCDLGINIASTISLELCMFDKPVINIAYDPPSPNSLGLSNARFYSFDHYQPVVESGAVQVAWTKEQAEILIAECLHEPSRRSRERKKLVDEMFGSTLDGLSSRRVAEVLLNIAKRES